MKQTEKMKLWLPEDTDPLEISKLSENFEKLDPMGAGIGALKDGMGVGSLFTVSKHYNEPIENALLCSGGMVDAAAYPELFALLGMTYGGTLTSDLLNSEYGITSALGYPQAYNADLDMFVYCNNANALTLYRKGQAPEKVPFSPNMNTTSFSMNSLFSFGHYVVVCYEYTSNYKSTAVWKYDLTAAAWAAVSGGTALWAFAYSGGNKSADIGDFILCPGTSVYVGRSIIDKRTAAEYTLTLKTPSGTTLNDVYPCVNLDDPDYVYIAYSNTSTIKNELYRFPKSALAEGGAQTVQLELVKSLPGSKSSTATSIEIQASSLFVISNGFCYARQNTILYYYNMATSASAWTQAHSGGSGGTLVLAKKISSAAAVLGYTGNSTYFIVSGASASTNSISSIIANPAAFQAGYGVVCTTSGVRGNWRVANFKLPTITMSEALVYIRTKGV